MEESRLACVYYHNELDMLYQEKERRAVQREIEEKDTACLE